MMISVFALFTSMFWFPKPEIVSENVKDFLEFEQTITDPDDSSFICGTGIGLLETEFDNGNWRDGSNGYGKNGMEY
ncbi:MULTISPECIES: hypothetical protein [Flavobacteriaceae]|uniref:hypothetical protein n=1 Tax=Flavobacteriaceae TaxID=49546 RepID=UPI00149279B1|nr:MULTISPECIES: hypothetical protein [Allomuricauda]MDC6365567.1 hypothetical protein [Muricauda sp. AC10]